MSTPAVSKGFPIGLRVLVVDDDPLCLKIVEKMLKRCQYEGACLARHMRPPLSATSQLEPEFPSGRAVSKRRWNGSRATVSLPAPR